MTGKRMATALTLCLALSLLSAEAARKKRPLTGFDVGPAMDRIEPGEFFIDAPTIQNLGFRWYVKGDSNRNATIDVSYRRKGEEQWQEAQPMLRVQNEIANQDYGPYRCGNLFAGSVLFLEPAAEYEVRFTMKDPDGGAAEPKIVTAATRPEPPAYKGLRQIHVYPPDFHGEKEPGSYDDLAKALSVAKPGDAFLLHKGIHKPGPTVLSRSGLADKPIVFRGSGDGEAVVEGPDLKSYLFDVRRVSHLVFEDLTLRTARIAIHGGNKGGPGTKDLVVRRCKIENVISGVWGYSEECENWFIADNVLKGINPTWHPRPRKGYMEPSHTGVNVYGRGHVVCYNRISRFSDSLAVANYGPPPTDLAKHGVNIDFYNNDLSWAQDDAVETDYGCHNIRVYRNRCANIHTALSAQPTYGGPIYFIRNEAYAVTALNLKFHNYCVGPVVLHNTLVTAGQGFRSFHKWQNAILRNNLILGARRYAMETGSMTPYTTLDYNGYRQNEKERFLKWYDGQKWGRYPTLDAFRQATGHEEHGMKVDYDIFVNAGPPKEGETRSPDSYDLRLKPNSAPVDAGCVLPNVNDDFTGKAPDLGCYEVDKALPHYGPRP